MSVAKFIAWLFGTWLSLKLLWLDLVLVPIGLTTQRLFGALGRPPENKSIAEHYGPKALFSTLLISFVIAGFVAFAVRYITFNYVENHWVYRLALFFFAPGITRYKQHGTLIAGEVGDLFLAVSASGSIWGWILALALAEVHLWFA